MHIVSWNVNGLPTTLKEASYHHQSLEKYFSEVLKADIVCFQVRNRQLSELHGLVRRQEK
jgi:exonuclease III